MEVRHFFVLLFFLVLVSITIYPVYAAAPVADFNGAPASGAVPLPVSFADASTGTPTGWAWFFGDENYTAPWNQVNASLFSNARWDSSSVAMPDGSIVLTGGYDGTGGHENETWRSTDYGVTWTLVNASSGWLPRDSQTSVVMPDGSIILMGGGPSTGLYNDTWRSTDTGATWVEVNASGGWMGRSRHSSVVMPDGSIILMGGYNTGGSIYNDVWRSTDNGATWVEMNASAGWSPRAGHSSVAMPDGSIIVMGGGAGTAYYKDVWRSADNGATWSQLPDAGWPERAGQNSVAMPDGSIVVTGGAGGDYLYYHDVWRSTDNGATWRQANANPGWAERAFHNSVAMPNGSIILTGGYGYSVYTNDVWQFNPVGSSADSPSHTYTRPGTYSVTLQVYNGDGYDRARKAGYITVTHAPAPAVTGITPDTGINTGTVTITDLHGTNFTTGAGVVLTPEYYNPVHQGFIADGAGGALLNTPADVAISGNYAYVASTGSNSLEIVDITDPANPVHAGNLTDGGGDPPFLTGASSVAVSGNYAYIVGDFNALEIVDISDPANPVHAASLSDGDGHEPYLSGSSGISVSGNYAYVVNTVYDALEIVDISDPLNPVHAGYIMDGAGSPPYLNTPENVFVSGTYAYVASYGSDALEVIDISIPADPVHAGYIVDGGGSPPFLSTPENVFVSGTYAYVTSYGSNALEIVDISDPTSPVHAGYIMDGSGGALLAGPTDIAVSGNHAYISSGTSNALEVVDITDPAHPLHAGSIFDGAGDPPFLSGPAGVALSGSSAYVTTPGSNILEVVDISTVPGTLVNVNSPDQIDCVLDLTGKIPGPYNVVVTNPDGQPGTLISGFTVTSGGTGTVHNLNSGLDYLTIQEAVDAANDFDSITVDSGTYPESVDVLEVPLEIRGSDTGGGLPIIDGLGGSAINVRTDGGVLDSLVLTNATGLWEGGITGDPANMTISNVTIETSFSGIFFVDASNVTIRNANVLGSCDYGFLFSGGKDIRISDSALQGSEGSTDGITFWSNADSHVTNVTIAGYDGNGVLLDGGNLHNTFDILNISDSSNGFRIQGTSNDNTITGSDLYANTKGIIIDLSDNNTVLTTQIHDNALQGIELNASFNTTISEDTIVSNPWGLFLSNSSSDNKVFNNNFTNPANVQDSSGTNIWNITKTAGTNIIGGPYLGGNFWSDYNGEDTNGDGLGDTLVPYNNAGSITTGGDLLPLIPNAALLPVPSFIGLPITGTAPLTVQFNDTSDAADPLMWNWSFGDTVWSNVTNSADRNVSHLYSAGGIYDVSLIVTNASGSNTTTRTGYIEVFSGGWDGVSCTVISNPGTYQLLGDIQGAPGIACIDIQSSDVLVEGNGHTLNGTAGSGFGVRASASPSMISNVIVRNLTISNWDQGVSYENVTGGVIDNITSIFNGNQGITLVTSSSVTLNNINASLNTAGIGIIEGSDYNVLTQVTANRNDAVGLWLYAARNNEVGSGTFDQNTGTGLVLEAQSMNNTVSGNSANFNSHGFVIRANSDGFISEYPYGSSINNTISNNVALNNTEIGITLFESANNNHITGNTVANNSIGIYCNATDGAISGNIIENNNASFNSYNGIAFSNATTNILTANTVISNGNNGILLFNKSRDNFLSDNTAELNGIDGFVVSHSRYNNLTHNNAWNNVHIGINLDTAENTTVLDNSVAGNDHGMLLYFASNNTIVNNSVSSNNEGFRILIDGTNSFTRNTVSANTLGIWVNSSQNKFFNNYLDNTNNVNDTSTGNFWNITKTAGTNIIGGPYLGGNFWSDYAGADTNGDGLGDTLVPYTANTYIVSGGDNLPLTSAAGGPVANGSVIDQYATLYIGEERLNVTHALNQAQGSPADGIPENTTIGWWASTTPSGAPSKSIDLQLRYASLFVAPDDFVGYTGSWYVLEADGFTPMGIVFSVQDPSLDIRIWDYTHDADASGTAVSPGTLLGFRIDTNMDGSVNNRAPLDPATDGFIDIRVINESGGTYQALYHYSTDEGALAGPGSIRANYVDVQPWYWGSPSLAWNTSARDNGNYLYPDGTYTVYAESTLHNMTDNYNFEGKSVSSSYTITIVTPRPVTSFTANTTSGTVPLAVQFNDTSQAVDPLMWNWSFGGNPSVWFNTTNSADRNASHLYTSPGHYTVSLKVTNASGSNTTSLPGYITVASPVTPANFTANTTFGTVPLAVLFVDTSDTLDPLMWNWSFGDDTWFNTTDSSLRNASHLYSTSGSFIVSLTVTNATSSYTMVRVGYVIVSTGGWTGAGGGSDGTSGDDQPAPAVVAPGPSSAIPPPAQPLNAPGVTADGISMSYPVGFEGLVYNDNGHHILEVNLEGARRAGATVTQYFNRVEIYQHHSPGVLLTFWGDKFDIVNGNLTGEVTRAELATDPLNATLKQGKVAGSVHAVLPELITRGLITNTISENVSAGVLAQFEKIAVGNGLRVNAVGFTFNVNKVNLTTGPANVTFSVPASWVTAHGGLDRVRITRISETTGREELLNTMYTGTGENGNLVFRGDSPDGTSLFGLLTAEATAAKQQENPNTTYIPASKPAMVTNVGMFGWLAGIVSENPLLVLIGVAILAAALYFGWWKRRL